MTDAFTHPWPFGGIFGVRLATEMQPVGAAPFGWGPPAALPGANPASMQVAGLLEPGPTSADSIH